MSIRVNERCIHGQHIIELFDKAKNRYAEIVLEPDGGFRETGDPTLIRVFRRKKLSYDSLSCYEHKKWWLERSAQNHSS